MALGHGGLLGTWAKRLPQQAEHSSLGSCGSPGPAQEVGLLFSIALR